MYELTKALLVLFSLVFFYIPNAKKYNTILLTLSILLISQFLIDKFIIGLEFMKELNFYGYGGRSSSFLHYFVLGCALRFSMLNLYTRLHVIFILYLLLTFGRFELIAAIFLIFRFFKTVHLSKLYKQIFIVLSIIVVSLTGYHIAITRTGLFEDSVRVSMLLSFDYSKIGLVGNTLEKNEFPIHFIPLGVLERVGVLYSLMYIPVLYVRSFLTMNRSKGVAFLLIFYTFLFSFTWHPYYYFIFYLNTKPVFKLFPRTR